MQRISLISFQPVTFGNARRKNAKRQAIAAEHAKRRRRRINANFLQAELRNLFSTSPIVGPMKSTSLFRIIKKIRSSINPSSIRYSVDASATPYYTAEHLIQGLNDDQNPTPRVTYRLVPEFIEVPAIKKRLERAGLLSGSRLIDPLWG